mmetsp:Transcript_3048/g.12430  ORF Transcript_3048/g.12430 Transcript_3048/m.12430 type:complete len:268 (-) Transcript_3048:1476-2279(-)
MVQEPETQVGLRPDYRRGTRLEGVLVIHGDESLLAERGGVVNERRPVLRARQELLVLIRQAATLRQTALGPVSAEEKVPLVPVAVLQEHVEHSGVRQDHPRVNTFAPASRPHRRLVVARLAQVVGAVHPVEERALVKRLVIELDAALGPAIRRGGDQVHAEHSVQLVSHILHGRAVPAVAVAVDRRLEHAIDDRGGVARVLVVLQPELVTRVAVLALHLAHRLHPDHLPVLQDSLNVRVLPFRNLIPVLGKARLLVGLLRELPRGVG